MFHSFQPGHKRKRLSDGPRLEALYSALGALIKRVDRLEQLSQADKSIPCPPSTNLQPSQASKTLSELSLRISHLEKKANIEYDIRPQRDTCKVYRCQSRRCGETFTTLEGLQDHIRKENGDDHEIMRSFGDEKFCIQCDKEFDCLRTHDHEEHGQSRRSRINRYTPYVHVFEEGLRPSSTELGSNKRPNLKFSCLDPENFSPKRWQRARTQPRKLARHAYDEKSNETQSNPSELFNTTTCPIEYAHFNSSRTIVAPPPKMVALTSQYELDLFSDFATSQTSPPSPSSSIVFGQLSDSIADIEFEASGMFMAPLAVTGDLIEDFPFNSSGACTFTAHSIAAVNPTEEFETVSSKLFDSRPFSTLPPGPLGSAMA